MNTWMSAEHVWTWHTLGSGLSIGTTTTTTTTINFIIVNHNFGCNYWWVCWYACFEHPGEGRGNLENRFSLVRLSKSQMHSQKLRSFLRMNNIKALAGYLEGCKMAVIYQFGKMIVDAGVFTEFGSQIWRKHVCKVRILGGNFCRGFLGNQAGYLRLLQRVDIKEGGAEWRIGTNWPNVNYVGLMLRVKRCSCKLFLTH